MEDQHQHTDQTRQVRARGLLQIRVNAIGESDETVVPPFPWATTRSAHVYSLEHLLAHDIKSISGTVKCKRCQEQYDIEFDLEEKFHDVAGFVARNKCKMHGRAPHAWMSPMLPTCRRCGKRDSLRPAACTYKRNTNWLFLLLGQMLGCCKLSYLQYFCKHTKNNRTGTKDRLVYLTYLVLCKQLQPDGPFDP